MQKIININEIFNTQIKTEFTEFSNFQQKIQQTQSKVLSVFQTFSAENNLIQIAYG